MRYDLIYIINYRLNNLKFINFIIAFYIVILYSYYSLYNYLIDKNYGMLIIYFTSLLILYKKFKKFSYLLCYILLIVFKLLNIDKIIFDGGNKFFNINVKLLENVSNLNDNDNTINVDGNSSLQDTLGDRANAMGDEQTKNIENSNPENNPCESYITKRLEEIGMKISSSAFNMDSAKDSAEKQIDALRIVTPLDTSNVDGTQRLMN